MSVATLVEVSIVIESRFGAEGLRDLDLFIDRAGIEIAGVSLVIAVSLEQVGVGSALAATGPGGHAVPA